MSDLERIFVVTMLARVIPTVIAILWDAIGQHAWRRIRPWFERRTDAAWDAVYRAYWRRKAVGVTERGSALNADRERTK